MKYFKKLVGEHIFLSPVSIEDVEKYTKWMNDFETTDYTGRSSQVYTIEDEKKWMDARSEDKESKIFGIVDLKNNNLIGNCGLHKIDSVNRTATLGIFIGEKQERSKGYGTEVIRLLLDYGFNYLNLHEIQLDVMSFNKRAIRCYEKAGFKEYGRRRESEYINGKYYDLISMDILKSEFKESYIKNKNI